MNAESIRIESDEHGWELHIDTTEDGTLIFNIHGVAAELYAAVEATIWPWIQEGEYARRHSVHADRYDGDGYALDDPKHPDYLAGADMLRDRARDK